jgi:RNA polymerase sigma factor (TIGR02999 family)
LNEITQILDQIELGMPQAAEKLLPLVYEDLRRLAAKHMASERGDHTLQTTALVHEAYLRLVGTNEGKNWNGRQHFYAAAAEAMRRILVDSARRKLAQKRGGNLAKVELNDVVVGGPSQDVDILALHEALDELERLDPRRATLVKLRYFAGLTTQEVADALGISRTTVASDWAFACCWLRERIAEAEA